MTMRFIALLIGAVLLNMLAFIMIKARPGIYKVKAYRPMMLNFKLSMLPLVILVLNIFVFLLLMMLGAYTEIRPLSVAAYILFFMGLFIWLLFLPNSGYLITELNLSHRSGDDKEVPIWYDIVSTLTLALSGIVNALVNIVVIQISFLVVFDPQELVASDYAILFFSGFLIILLIVIGIYLGRALRLNSWDVMHPRAFLTRLKEHFSKRNVWKDFALYTVFNTLFFVIMYIAFGIPFYFVA